MDGNLIWRHLLPGRDCADSCPQRDLHHKMEAHVSEIFFGFTFEEWEKVETCPPSLYTVCG